MAMRVEGHSQVLPQDSTKTSSTSTSQESSFINSAFSGGSTISNGVSQLVQGGDISDVANQTVQGTFSNIKNNIGSMIKEMLVGALERLFTGNDKADATKAQGQTAGNIAQTATTLTATQKKVLDAGLMALRELVTEGTIDINESANRIKDLVKSCNAKNQEGTASLEKQQELVARNEEIKQELAALGVNIEEAQDTGGSSGKKGEVKEIMIKGPDGKPIPAKTIIEGNSGENSGANPNADKIKELLQEYQNNSATIAVLSEQITEIVTTQTEEVTVAEEIQVEIQTQKDELTQNVQQQTSNMINQSRVEINTAVNTGNTSLTADATDAFLNAGIDTGTAAAAPEIAAGIEVSTVGLGTGEAAKVIANGIQDGIAATIRSATGSSALGGIASNIMAGQSLSDALANVAMGEMNRIIGETIDQIAPEVMIGELNVTDLVLPELKEAVTIKDNTSTT